MNVLDLFSGIGGFSLGLERAGMRTVAFCEIDPYCRAVLRRHWADVPVFEDVRTLTAASLQAALADAASERTAAAQQPRQLRGPFACGIDLICGGFPCQDISAAGKGAGIDGERSGLWREFARIIGEVQPRYVIVENVSALLGRGLSRVLGDLAALGFDAEWHCIPASSVGAPHRRDRVWIVAYPGCQHRDGWGSECAGPQSAGSCDWAARSGEHALHVADADRGGREEQWKRLQIQSQLASAECAGWWESEPDVGRVAHGVPGRVDRLRSLGNAVVPQIPEMIGRAILETEQEFK